MFVTTGTAMMTSMGGASGALFGTVYRAGGKALAGRATFDAEGLALLLEAALEGVMKRGGAKPGDKTMIDAVAPAAAKARESIGLSLTEALAATAAAAEAGKEASKDMIAQFGRAKDSRRSLPRFSRCRRVLRRGDAEHDAGFCEGIARRHATCAAVTRRAPSPPFAVNFPCPVFAPRVR